ncbi:MAG: hypothetical protein BEU04_01995 [Marine Group III euryarchaeote CG-Bathy1]|uniref:Uncharacterized protein n=1 Tax=Marine Group III euryarchaeote CG-Bathy1 TaxID=1889001 RepID=A0A1J5THC9_9ARCH|nr:MAG: hypothetical protein BEU04_01995 [Marine Group III euryarchaeote CG-Bathy1]
MEEELWQKVRTRLFPEDSKTSNKIMTDVDSTEQHIEEKNTEQVEDSVEDYQIDNTSIYATLGNFLNSIDFSVEDLLNQESALYKILQKGIFSGFLHLIFIIFLFGIISSYIFTIPAWFCGMIAGFFAGKKSGDMSRAIVATVLLFSIAYFFFTLSNLGYFPPISDKSDTHAFSISVFEWLLGGVYSFGGISGLVNPSSPLFISSLCFSIFGSYVEIFKIPIKTES